MWLTQIIAITWEISSGDAVLLLNLAKIFIPAILSSALITFYFQKRLARIGNYEQITAELMKRLFEGTERVYQKAQQVNYHVELLRGVLIKDPIVRDELIRVGKDVQQSGTSFLRAMEEHRIYILSIIPFGGSGILCSSIAGIVSYTELLEEALESGDDNEDKERKLILKLHASFQQWSGGYNGLRTAIQESQKHILEGKLP